MIAGIELVRDKQTRAATPGRQRGQGGRPIGHEMAWCCA